MCVCVILYSDGVTVTTGLVSSNHTTVTNEQSPAYGKAPELHRNHKFVPVHTMKAYTGSRSTALLMRNLSTRC